MRLADRAEKSRHGCTAGAGQYPRTKATREDWLRAALDTLIADGVERVKILVLARKLDVSRSSFYWYFASRRDLLDQLLEVWSATNTRGIVEQALKPSRSITQGVLNLFACWVDKELFDPRLDFAVREWARRSRPVHRVVDRADRTRVAAIKDLFLRHGYDDTDAFIRARVLYFMQIGYYALDLKETLAERLSYTDAYLRAFTGREPDKREVERFARNVRR